MGCWCFCICMLVVDICGVVLLGMHVCIFVAVNTLICFLKRKGTINGHCYLHNSSLTKFRPWTARILSVVQAILQSYHDDPWRSPPSIRPQPARCSTIPSFWLCSCPVPPLHTTSDCSLPARDKIPSFPQSNLSCLLSTVVPSAGNIIRGFFLHLVEAGADSADV